MPHPGRRQQLQAECSLVDHRVIWQTPTEASLKAAVNYYHDALDGPPWLAAGVASLTGVAIVSILFKLAKGTTSRVLFDGGSLRELDACLPRTR